MDQGGPRRIRSSSPGGPKGVIISEMMTPLGPPGEDDLILLGPLPLIHCCAPVASGRHSHRFSQKLPS